MLRAWFVSDIHITSQSDKKAKKLLAFLRSLVDERTCTHLFLVGDIFDLWVADHNYFLKEYDDIIKEISRLTKIGVEVHYFEGNHDLHLKKFWQENLGVEVHEDRAIFDFFGNRVLVEHGDLNDPDDEGYLFLRWFLRTPLMKFISYNLPEKWVAKIGENASRASRKYTSQTIAIDEEEAKSRLHWHAEKSYTDEPFDILVNGHVHVRDEYQSPKGFRAFNLGTWLKQPIALTVDEEANTEWVHL